MGLVTEPLAALLDEASERALDIMLQTLQRSLNEDLSVFVSLAFFASGAAGLVYQVAWQRILALHSGVGIYSVAMIVAAFMAGLGIGSHLGGRASLRLAPAAALRRFVLLELGIAVFGASSCDLYYDFLFETRARRSTRALAGRRCCTSSRCCRRRC